LPGSKKKAGTARKKKEKKEELCMATYALGTAAALSAVQEQQDEEKKARNNDDTSEPSGEVEGEGEVCRLCGQTVPLKDFSDHCLYCLVGSSCASNVAFVNDRLTGVRSLYSPFSIFPAPPPPSRFQARLLFPR
jgi:hypothetical protein